MGILVPSQPYTISTTITNPGAVTNLNLQAAATKPFVVVRCTIEIAQATIPSSAGCLIRMIRKTAAPTVTSIAASTFMNMNPSDNDASLTAGHTATAEGTDGDYVQKGWRSDIGFEWQATPEEYIVVPAGTANGFGIKSITAPPAGVYEFTIVAHEIG